jgi:hypothetical protein
VGSRLSFDEIFEPETLLTITIVISPGDRFNAQRFDQPVDIGGLNDSSHPVFHLFCRHQILLYHRDFRCGGEPY